jgi:hypothetical protein
LETQPHTTLNLMLANAVYSPFFPLLQQGFLVKAQIGRSIKNLLCEQFEVKDNYLTNRINTIFLDGKPVDDADTAIVRDGSTLALSAAMPGLVGATFRRSGILAGFRSSITHQREDETAEKHNMGMVKIKLFNLVVGELGPIFLKKGIWVRREAAEDMLKHQLNLAKPFIVSAEKDGEKMSHVELAALNWAEQPENVFLKVINIAVGRS